MLTTVICPHCDARLSVPAGTPAGGPETRRCPECGKPVTIAVASPVIDTESESVLSTRRPPSLGSRAWDVVASPRFAFLFGAVVTAAVMLWKIAPVFMAKQSVRDWICENQTTDWAELEWIGPVDITVRDPAGKSDDDQFCAMLLRWRTESTIYETMFQRRSTDWRPLVMPDRATDPVQWSQAPQWYRARHLAAARAFGLDEAIASHAVDPGAPREFVRSILDR